MHALDQVWETVRRDSDAACSQAAQAARLDHATTLGATNPVAELLAQRLCDLTSMDRAFFAGDGASAIETALKMTIQYWQNVGQAQKADQEQLGQNVGRAQRADQEQFGAQGNTRYAMNNAGKC